MWGLGYALALAALGASQSRKLGGTYSASAGATRSSEEYVATDYATNGTTTTTGYGNGGSGGDGNGGSGGNGNGGHGGGGNGGHGGGGNGGHGGKPGGHDGHGHLDPSGLYHHVTGKVKGIADQALDTVLVPIGGRPGEDLGPWAGKCNAIVNLVQLLPAGDSMNAQKFAHIKRMVHFMLDGFVLGDKYSHAGVICGCSAPKKLFGLSEAAGHSNIEARTLTSSMQILGGVVSIKESLEMAITMMRADQRDNAINVVILHTDGNFKTEHLTRTIEELQNIPRMVPIVVNYGQTLYDKSNELKQAVSFAECLDLEFCPNFIPAKWSPASLISSQLAVKQYIATAVRAVPAGYRDWDEPRP